MQKFGKSLRFKVSLIVFLTNITFAVICGFIYFLLYRQNIQEYLVEISTMNANNIRADIEKKLLDIDRFSTWCVLNESFQTVLKLPDLNDARRKKQVLAAQKDLIAKLTTIESYPYVLRVLLEGSGGVSFQAGTYFSGTGEPNSPQSNQACQQVTESSLFSMLFTHWQKNEEGRVFFISGRKILGISDASETGDMYIEISSRLFEDVCKKYVSSPLTSIHIVNDENRLVYSTEGEFTGRLIEIPKKPVREKGSLLIPIGVRSEYARLTILFLVPFKNSSFQRSFITNIILLSLLLNSIAAATIYLVFVRGFTQKINRIWDKVGAIAQNNFSRDLSIEGFDEIGYIGREINRMSAAIEQMMASIITAEREKKILELEALQRQINPHFLYNTLNSIKWMAQIQGSEGIVEAVTSLSRLLRNIASNTAEKITLAEELQLVRDYCAIQNILYKGKFSLHIHCETGTEQCLIVKFTLQPLVENAIFHGLEPKNGKGNIHIRILYDGEFVCIEVRDNGIGMEQEKAESLLRENIPEKSSLSRIGLGNVLSRLRLIYGETCSLKIESAPSRGTLVRILIPKETG